MKSDAQLEAAWKKVAKPKAQREPGPMWSLSVGPPLPSEWPMTPKGTLVRWVFAAAMDIGLHDGERVGSAWARVDLAADGTETVTVVATALEDLGVQGVRPITKEQAAELRAAFTSEDALRAGELTKVKAPFCRWAGFNGVIAARLKAHHAAFFKALACDARE
jgi:hypothetical protein